jgi:hypothetical protein
VLLLTVAIAFGACGSDTSEPRSVVPSDNAPAAATTQQTVPAAGSPPPAATTATTPPTTATQPAPRTTPRRPAHTRTQTTQPDPAPTPTTATTPHEPEPEPEPAGTPVDEFAVLTLVERRSAAHYFQQGTVTGTFDGTMALEARVRNRGVVVYFTATVEGGTISGKGVAIPTIGDSPIMQLRGTAKITGGTGRFASIRGRRLTVAGTARLDATRARVRLTGTVFY